MEFKRGAFNSSIVHVKSLHLQIRSFSWMELINSLMFNFCFARMWGKMYIQDFKRSFNFYVVQSGSLYGIDSVTLQQKLRLFMVITVRPEQVP